MARPLRIDPPGAWHHVTGRGNGGERLFHADADRRRFLGLVSELPGRFGLEIHAFVLMDNHWHLLVRSVSGNLSEAVRWLLVTHAARHNLVHRRRGHLYQGRFSWWNWSAGCRALGTGRRRRGSGDSGRRPRHGAKCRRLPRRWRSNCK